jgi:(p)ppGpp synthase/HD superfamily hydrolase
MRLVREEFNPALIVKVADRVANVRTSKAINSSMYEKYKSEYTEFKRAVYRPYVCPQLWDELNSLME